MEVALARIAGIRGRVTDAGTGAAVAGAVVTFDQLAPADRTALRHGLPSRVMESWGGGRTDAEGRFVVNVGRGGDLVLRVEKPGFAPGELALRGVDSKAGAGPFEVALTQGGAIEGRVIVADGASPEG